ncbi:MAG: DUF2334 domain-containing protein [Nitrososphaerales archaeon]
MRQRQMGWACTRNAKVMGLILAISIPAMITQPVYAALPECQRCIAFRLDDIQDFYLTKSQMEIIQTFEKRNTSLTIGVIGNFIGEDLQLRAFLRERVNSSGAFNMEVANHGWDHEDFTAFDKDQQSELLSKSQESIFETLGVTPDVFIAPFNRMNNDTLVAILENDIRVVSANVTQDNRPFARKITLGDSEAQVGITVFHVPATAKTGDLNDDDTQWLGFGHQQTLDEIEKSMEEHGYALVMLHPQEFSVRNGLDFKNDVDKDQIGELELLLDGIQEEGYSIVLVSQLARQVAIPEFADYLLPAAMTLPFISVIAFLLLHRFGSPRRVFRRIL